jgi:hypothetical protein
MSIDDMNSVEIDCKFDCRRRGCGSSIKND